MIINGQEVYLYNPFNVKRWTEEEIEKEVFELEKQYDPAPRVETPYVLSKNIEILSNINYLYGEMISRIQTDVADLKLECEVNEAKSVYEERRKWNETHSEKAPSITYFEAIAKQNVREMKKKLSKLNENFSRFKYAYGSYQDKINAIKYRINAIKYEEFGQQ